MNDEIKKTWLEALRSDRYKQGKRLLRYEDRYCCLGVLCDLVEPLGWHQDGLKLTYHHLNKSTIPDITVINKAGLNSEDIRIPATMNDGGYSFLEIANWIEVNL